MHCPSAAGWIASFSWDGVRSSHDIETVVGFFYFLGRCEQVDVCLGVAGVVIRYLVPDVDERDLHAVHHQVLLEACIHFQSVLAALLGREAVIYFFLGGSCSILAFGTRFTRTLIFRGLGGSHTWESHAGRCRT